MNHQPKLSLRRSSHAAHHHHGPALRARIHDGRENREVWSVAQRAPGAAVAIPAAAFVCVGLTVVAVRAVADVYGSLHSIALARAP